MASTIILPLLETAHCTAALLGVVVIVSPVIVNLYLAAS